MPNDKEEETLNLIRKIHENEYVDKVQVRNQRGIPPKNSSINTRSLKELEKKGVVNNKLTSGAKSSIVRSSQVTNTYDESPRLRNNNDSPYDKKSTGGKSDTLERAIQH